MTVQIMNHLVFDRRGPNYDVHQPREWPTLVLIVFYKEYIHPSSGRTPDRQDILVLAELKRRLPALLGLFM